MADSPRPKTSRAIFVLIAVLLLLVSYQVIKHHGTMISSTGPGASSPANPLARLKVGPPVQGPLSLVAVAIGTGSLTLAATKYDAATVASGVTRANQITFVIDSTTGFGIQRITVPRGVGITKIPVGDDILVFDCRQLKPIPQPNGRGVEYIGTPNLQRPGEEHWSVSMPVSAQSHSPGLGSEGEMEQIRYWIPKRRDSHFTPPYTVEEMFPDASNRAAMLQRTSDTYDLVPSSLDGILKVGVTPLDDNGAECGSHVVLKPTLLGHAHATVSLPCTYSPQTTQIRLEAHLVSGDKALATWTVDVPQSSAGHIAASPTGPSATFGPLKLECAAAIDSSDIAGGRDFNAPPLNLTEGTRPISPPTNFDSHKFTGIPAVRAVVRGRLAPGTTDWWAYAVQHVTAGTGSSAAKPVQGVGWTTIYGYPTKWYGVDGEIVGGYPGSEPKSVEIDGIVEHFGSIAETISLAGWRTVSDSKGGACLVWNTSTRITTPSGVVIVPMNPSDLATAGGPIDTSVAAYQPPGGERYITVYLAIKLPASETQSAAQMPTGIGGLSLGAQAPFHAQTSSQQSDWANAWTPGTAKIQRVPGQMGHPPSPQLPLIRSNFEVYKLQIMYGQASLPANISLKVQRTTLLGSRPFKLAATVQNKFPAGWKPADFDATEYRPTR